MIHNLNPCGKNTREYSCKAKNVINYKSVQVFKYSTRNKLAYIDIKVCNLPMITSNNDIANYDLTHYCYHKTYQCTLHGK